MADYHIYIHSETTSSSGNKTKPWRKTDKSFNTQSKSSSAQSAFNKVIRTASNPDSLISAGTNIISKAIPAIAAAAVVVSVVDKVVNEVIEYKTIIGGDYATQRRYNNFKQKIKNIFTPVSTWNSANKAEYANINMDQTSKLTNELLGDDYINSFNGYGV